MSSGKNRTLIARLTRTYGLLFWILLTLLGLAILLSAFAFLIHRQQQRLLTTGELVTDHILEELYEGELLSDQKMLEEQNTNVDMNLYLLDPEGHQINQVINFYFSPELFPSETAAPRLCYRAGALSLAYRLPVADESMTYGALVMALNLDTEQTFLEMLALLLLGADLLGAAVSLLLGYRAGKRLLSPIDKMIDSARGITGRNLGERLEVPQAKDELRDLALTINHMLDRLQESFEAQTRFVSDASHELRTPLAVLQGNCELLERWGAEDPAVLKDSISSLSRQTAYMNRLVESLLLLARSDGRRLPVHPEQTALFPLLLELKHEQLLVDTAHTYTFACPEEAELFTDPSLLRQLLRALLDNAVKYTPEGGTISLGCREEADGLALYVQDTGIGIPPEHLPHLFERFYRVDAARSKATGGQGLGLSIAATIARNLGARLEVESQPDQGSTFTILFPADRK